MEWKRFFIVRRVIAGLYSNLNLYFLSILSQILYNYWFDSVEAPSRELYLIKVLFLPFCAVELAFSLVHDYWFPEIIISLDADDTINSPSFDDFRDEGMAVDVMELSALHGIGTNLFEQIFSGRLRVWPTTLTRWLRSNHSSEILTEPLRICEPAGILMAWNVGRVFTLQSSWHTRFHWAKVVQVPSASSVLQFSPTHTVRWIWKFGSYRLSDSPL